MNIGREKMGKNNIHIDKIVSKDKIITKCNCRCFVDDDGKSTKESFKCSWCFKCLLLHLPLFLFLLLPLIFYKLECSFLKIFENPVFLICFSLITITVIICITKIIIEHDLKERKIKEIDKIFNQHQNLIFSEYEKKEIKIDFFKHCIDAISEI